MTPWRFIRRKPKNIVTSLAYRIGKLLPMTQKGKFKLFSDLAWIFNRMCLENSSGLYDLCKYVPYTQRMSFIEGGISKDDYVLDLGCSTGEITNFVAGVSKEVVGIDHDLNRIAMAKQRHQKSNLSFVCDDAISYLSSSNKKFDSMICSHILEHLDNPVDFLRKFQGCFTKLYIEVPDNDQQEVNHMRIACDLTPLYNDLDHIWEFKRIDIAKIFQELNLEIISRDFSYGVMRYWVKWA